MKLWIISDFVMEEAIRELSEGFIPPKDDEWGGVSFVIEKFILTEMVEVLLMKFM